MSATAAVTIAYVIIGFFCLGMTAPPKKDEDELVILLMVVFTVALWPLSLACSLGERLRRKWSGAATPPEAP